MSIKITLQKKVEEKQIPWGSISHSWSNGWNWHDHGHACSSLRFSSWRSAKLTKINQKKKENRKSNVIEQIEKEKNCRDCSSPLSIKSQELRTSLYCCIGFRVLDWGMREKVREKFICDSMKPYIHWAWFRPMTAPHLLHVQ